MTRQFVARTKEPFASIMCTPRSVDIEITSRCNLRCRYCYFFDNPAVDYRDLPTEEWLRFFEGLGRCGVMNLTLAGGEPFIRKDLTVLIEGIVCNRMRFSILSNGMLLAAVDENGSVKKVKVCTRYIKAGKFNKAPRGLRKLEMQRQQQKSA